MATKQAEPKKVFIVNMIQRHTSVKVQPSVIASDWFDTMKEAQDWITEHKKANTKQHYLVTEGWVVE